MVAAIPSTEETAWQAVRFWDAMRATYKLDYDRGDDSPVMQFIGRRIEAARVRLAAAKQLGIQAQRAADDSFFDRWMNEAGERRLTRLLWMPCHVDRVRYVTNGPEPWGTPGCMRTYPIGSRVFPNLFWRYGFPVRWPKKKIPQLLANHKAAVERRKIDRQVKNQLNNVAAFRSMLFGRWAKLASGTNA